MRVGIDGKCLLPPRAGVARYLEGVLGALAASPHPDATIDVLAPPRPRRTLPWALWDLRRATRRYDVMHFPFYYPPPFARCPVTVAVHDVLVLEHPEWFTPRRLNTLRAMIPSGTRRSAAVVTGSRCVAEAIVGTCGVTPERIRVIGYGLDHRRFAVPPPAALEAFRRRLGLERPFVLQLGALEPRRGTDLALAAVEALRPDHRDLELVLAGEARMRIAALDAPPPWVRLLGRVADDDLPALYAAAAAVVAPSRGEGFDFPVLEALACGAVVVASDIAVHVEHFAEAVELFASGDGAALAGKLGAVLADSARATALHAAGPRVAARFTWEEAARAHLGLWREVAR